MPFVTSIQSLSSAHTSGVNQIAVDWANQKIFNDGNTTGNATVIGLISGNELATVPDSTWVNPVGGGGGGLPTLVDANGNFYTNWFQHDGGGWIKISPSLTQLAAGGADGLPPVGFVLAGGTAAVIPYAGTQYILANGQGPGGGVLGFVALFNEVTYAGLNVSFGAGVTPNAEALVCAGQTGTKYGFVLWYPESNTDTQLVVLAKVDITVPSMTTINSYAPAAINGAWTTIAPAGICVDQTDGNPIIWFQNKSIIAGGTGAMVKVDKNTGAVVWNTATFANALPPMQFGNSSILHQKLAIIGGSPLTVTTFNTASGAASSYTTNLAGTFPYGPQCYNDTLGCIVLNVQYLNQAGAPVPLNSTPGSLNDWAALYVNPAFVPPPPPPRRWLWELGPVRH